MADIVFSPGIVLSGEGAAPTPSRSSNPLNSMTPSQANAWQRQQDQLARQAAIRARPPSSVGDMFRRVGR